MVGSRNLRKVYRWIFRLRCNRFSPSQSNASMTCPPFATKGQEKQHLFTPHGDGLVQEFHLFPQRYAHCNTFFEKNNLFSCKWKKIVLYCVSKLKMQM